MQKVKILTLFGMKGRGSDDPRTDQSDPGYSNERDPPASYYFAEMFEQVAELAERTEHSQALMIVRERNELLVEQKKKIEEQEAYLKFQTSQADSISA